MVALSIVTNRPHEIYGIRIPTLKMNITRNSVDTMILTYDPNTDIVTYSDDNSRWEMPLGQQLTDLLFEEKRKIIYYNLNSLKNWGIGHVDNFDLEILKDVLIDNCDSDYYDLVDY